MLTRILGYPPICSASPSWKCNALVLIEKEKFAFRYNSDCRGNTLFRPIIKGRKLYPPQIPVTLPTYDEIIGRNSVSDGNYNDYMLSLIRPEDLNVLTIHAEVEGIARLEMFKQFVETAQSKGISFVPLGSLLSDSTEIGIANVIPKEIPGRDGWVAYQKEIEKE